MPQIPQPPQPPRLPRPPAAPPEARKLGGLFKRRRQDDDLAEDGPEGSAAPAASEEPPPAPIPYETWAWPSVEPQQEKGKAPLIVLVAIVLLVLAAGGFGAYKLFHEDEKSPAPAKSTPTKPVASRGKAERLYVDRVESILAASVAQRASLVQVLAATENGCSI